jgi:hypothetical protein
MKENPMSDTPKDAKTRITRTRKAAASRAGGLLASARDLAGQAGAASTTLAETFPGAADTLKGTALNAYHTVESMPKSQQRTMTRASLGIGAALFVLGAPRLLTFLAFLPALAVAGMRLAKHRA